MPTNASYPADAAKLVGIRAVVAKENGVCGLLTAVDSELLSK
jgi:hypothetical protein